MGASDLLPGDGVVYETRVLPGSDAEPVTNGTLKALNPATGAVLWQLSGHAYSGLALMGTTLYANADDALHAFNTQTGAEIWTFSVPKSTVMLTMWHDGTTIYLTDLTNLYAIDGATHTVRWHISSTSTPGGVVENGVYCGPGFKDMYGYDTNTGAQKWHIQRPNGYGTIVSDGGLCIATGFGPETPIVAVDAQTGAVRWSYTASISYVRTLAADGDLFVLGSTSTVMENSDSILRAVSEKDGSVLWTFDTQDHSVGSMALG
jgi:outer membrane protein assembly factor BamB